MTATEPTTLRVELLDPHDLAPHPRNVRADLGDLTGLTDSIREQGVIEPLTVVPHGAGYQLVAGHRRAAAAIAAGLDAVPCVIREDLAADADDSPTVAEHVGAMLAENLHRAGLTAIEEARGVKQMLDLGVPISRVAKRTGLGQKRVKKAIGVARLDDTAAAAVEAQQLDLDAAAAIALYAGEPETVGRLVAAAKHGPGQLAHALEREKQARKAQAAYEARVAELRAAGRVVVDESPNSGTKNRRLTGLNGADGKWLAEDEAAHLTCPGAAVYVALQWGDVFEAEVCTDIAANGHVDRWHSSAGGSSKPETPEEKAAASAERRKVIENNKAMAAANTVRRGWVRQYLARRSAPTEVLRFAIEEIAASPDAVHTWLSGSHTQESEDAVAELGLVRPSRWRKTDISLTSGEQVPDGRLPLQLLAHLAAAVDGTITKDAWRWKDHDRDRLVRWLTFLAGQGYTLADVEQEIIDGAAR